MSKQPFVASASSANDSLHTLRTLHREGSSDDAARVQALLAGAAYHQFELTHAQNMAEATELLSRDAFELLIVDMSLSDGHGLEVLDALHEWVTGQAIIVLSSLEDEDLAMDAVMHGADDYLLKRRTGAARLLRAVQFALDRRNAGHRFSHISHGVVPYKVFVHALESKIDLEHSLQRSQAVLFHFQLENLQGLLDAYGAEFVRRLEHVFCQRIDSCMGHAATIYRGNSDDHIIALYNAVGSEECLKDFNHRLVEALEYPFKIHNTSLFLVISVGVSELEQHHIDSPQAWLDSAMVAAQMAKANNRACYIAKGYEAEEIYN